MTGRTDFAVLRTQSIAQSMGVKFNHQRGAKLNVHALEIRRMEREAQALQTKIDANPYDLEAGAAMRLLQERLANAYIEYAAQCPESDHVPLHRENYKPAPEHGSFAIPLACFAVMVTIFTALALQWFGVLRP